MTLRPQVRLGAVLVALAVSAFAGPASADIVKFYNGTTGYSGPFNGAGTLYNSITTQNVLTSCPGGGGSCPNDVLAATETFNASVSIRATANGSNNVWDDLAPNFGGLGVGLASQGSDADQIATSDVLHIHFATAVVLTGVATLFSNEHADFGTGFPDNSNITGTNTILINGVSKSLGSANSGQLTGLSGTDFTFQEASGQPAFYVSALSFTAVPAPIAGAGLPCLLLVSASLLGWWRRKRKAEVAA